MHPNLPGTNPGRTVETLDADRQIGASRLLGGLGEIAIGVDQRGIEVQTGIEKGRMQSGVTVNGEMRGQPNPCQNLAAAPLQHLDAAKRFAIFQSERAQTFIIAVDRDRQRRTFA